MKENPITIGFDDAKFKFRSQSKTTQLIGVVCQGVRMVKVGKKEIFIDGNDATEKIIELININEKHVQYVMTHTITFGGFNLVNLEKIYNETGKPIIAITDREVDLEMVKIALIKKFPDDYKTKLQHILSAGNLYEISIETAGGLANIYFHSKGIEIVEIENLLKKTCIDSKLPECIRLAHMIGKLF